MKLILIAVALAALLELTYSQLCDPRSDFDCGDGYCIPGPWVCDGFDDCDNGSDEKGDSDSCPPCPPAINQCKNGKCTSPNFICDGYDDCGDGSDEADENGKCPDCPSAAYKCPGTGACILPEYACDGFNDCYDWSDETEDACPCADNELRCSKKPGEEDVPPGDCIPEEWVCDPEGIWDCPNGDDEANCTVRVVGSKSSKKNRVHPIRLRKKANKEKLRETQKLSKKLSSKRHSIYKQNQAK